ncbi:hypothetical protein [Lysinibacillus telephonicus]|uniref:hypothetical protein n=1 Tax=Lysinibacillus telephonicus TaxID=1714840 RepID=UPI0037D70CF7
MATNTTNYNLIKPDVDDFYDVNQFNQNADIIDTQLKNNADSIKAILTNDLTALPPIEATLNSGENTLTTEHDSTARVTAFEGDTIVNYVPLFDSGVWGFSSDFVVNSPSKVTLTVSDGANHGHYVVFPVKANSDYTFNVKHNANIAIYKVDGTPIQNYTSDQVITFNTGTETSIRIYFRNPNLTNGTFTFEEPMLNEGTEQKPFVANVQGITNPTIDNPTTGDSLTLLGTFHKGDVVSEDKGQYSKQGTKKETILDDKLTYSVTNYTGFKRILVQGLPKALLNSQGNDYQVDSKLVKYNGLLIPISSGISPPPSADVHKLTNGATDGNLYFTVSNADIGIGDNYTPTADELKAFILGYVMYDGTKGASAVPGVDLWNGTTSNTYKYWAYRGDSGAWVSVGTTLPTTQAPINSKWKPYKLVYDLASPVKESVQAINSVLKLAKGDNTLQVSEGRIVREKVKSFYLYSGGWYLANDKNQPQTEFDYMTAKIVAVYENGEPFTNYTISDTNAYGSEKIQIPKDAFNPTAVYEVDYEPLYPFEVTAPTNPITIEYQSNLASVVGQNVEDIVELKEDVAVIERDMVRKGEGVQWFDVTLLNGWVNYGGNDETAGYSKDSLNTVKVKGLIKNGAIAGGTVLFMLPKGFRPKKTVTFPTQCADVNGAIDSNGRILITPNGQGMIWSVTKNNWLTLDIITFKAEQ